VGTKFFGEDHGLKFPLGGVTGGAQALAYGVLGFGALAPARSRASLDPATVPSRNWRDSLCEILISMFLLSTSASPAPNPLVQRRETGSEMPVRCTGRKKMLKQIICDDTSPLCYHRRRCSCFSLFITSTTNSKKIFLQAPCFINL
jgi:hypothetical protein